jgi:DNA (cytosine-5)-methyltransferase 1
MGGQCVFSSEWDARAQQTYAANFGETPLGDITRIQAGDVPSHNLLVAGFPCQPFSIAGVSKKNSLGREHGFKDATQGNLFFEIVRLLAHHTPDAFVLENVKNLRSHDSGRTYAVIITKLRQLGYHVFDKVIDARVLVPQHRERIFIVGFRDFRTFDFPEFPTVGPKFQSILEKKAPDKYFLSPHLWNYLQRYAEKHRKKGNGFGFGLTPRDGVARTLSARYYKDGSEILIDEGRPTPRRLTPRECASLMGFPEDFKIVVADTPAYKQFGNSVVVPVAKAVAQCVVKALDLGKGSRKKPPARAPGPPRLSESSA